MYRVLVIAVALLLLAGCGKPDPQKKAASDAAMKEIRYQRMAREFVTPHLKDGKSAEFRNQEGFCGEVNSKNSFGAYTGFQRFIATGAQMVVFERGSGLSASDFSKVWNDICK